MERQTCTAERPGQLRHTPQTKPAVCHAWVTREGGQLGNRAQIISSDSRFSPDKQTRLAVYHSSITKAESEITYSRRKTVCDMSEIHSTHKRVVKKFVVCLTEIAKAAIYYFKNICMACFMVKRSIVIRADQSVRSKFCSISVNAVSLSHLKKQHAPNM